MEIFVNNLLQFIKLEDWILQLKLKETKIYEFDKYGNKIKI